MSGATLEDVQARIQQLGQQRLPGLLRLELLRAALFGEGEAKGLAGTVLKVRSGMLRRSIIGKVDGDSRIILSAGDGQRVRYAAIHEYGGTIRPKRGKYLAIPVGPALTSSGVARYASPRDVPGLTFAQSRKGQPMLVQAQKAGRGKTGRAAGTVMFLLRRQVTIRARPFMGPAMKKTAEALAERLPKVLVEVISGQ